MLVLCDFDGTITLKDVTDVIADEFTGTTWRDTILPPYQAGQLSHLEVMRLIYADLHTPYPDLVAFYQTAIVRAGFEKLVDFCQSQNYPLIVVSGGLDFYLKDLLPATVPFHSYVGEWDANVQNWQVRRPDWPVVNDQANEDFKVRVLEELVRQHSQSLPTVFIGDGRNDFRVAQVADWVFAVKGSRLAQMCGEVGKACTEFEDFTEVIAELRNKNLNDR